MDVNAPTINSVGLGSYIGSLRTSLDREMMVSCEAAILNIVADKVTSVILKLPSYYQGPLCQAELR